ncbi:MAG: peptidase S15 [Rhodospirillaceae bacterium]|nr:peptidase S15 [Rhodospirillaceae bacterium]|tara:strand:+ start:3329 stop:5347 length:2019 start_codon:yes stop_codon:yes gene_type:complete
MSAENDSPEIVTAFPCAVRHIEHLWVPMPDGTRLSARVWLPEDAEDNPVPAILEYIPYRKRDGTRGRDDSMHGWWAGHGYACIRLDIRGTGESEGLITDEYSRQELQDGFDAIAWFAEQPWCSGAVGMTGISWGGFNGLQVAAMRPAALKAIITHCSTDDRYADDVHFMGGALALDNWFWGGAFFQFMARPGDPEIQGERWREQWMKRLEAWEPVSSTIWLQHQRRDAYWKHGSVCEDYDDIECAVFAVGGWEDGYSNAIPRMLGNLKGPRKGLVGPWGHKFPHLGIPGPAIGWLQEGLRWWDHWLKGVDNGLMDEPMYRVWMREPSVPDSRLATVQGKWIDEPVWPQPDPGERHWVLWRSANGARTVKPRQTVGVTAGNWCPYQLGGASPDLAIDQSEDDGRSLVFETEPLQERIEFLGQPVVRLNLSVDQPQGFVAVRLVDVAPDDTAARVTYQVLNLTHRDDHEAIADMPVNEPVDLAIRLNDMAWSFPAGHRIRVSLSTAYWPVIWPSRAPVILTVHDCDLTLPERTPRDSDGGEPFDRIAIATPTPHTELTPPNSERTVTRDLATGEWKTIQIEDNGVWRFDAIDLECAESIHVEYRIRDDDPLSASACWTYRSARRRDGWDIAIESSHAVRASRDAFVVDVEICAKDEGREVYHRSWSHEVPRDGV